MNIERMYLSALELTHQMLDAAISQDWETLTEIEKERARIVEESVHTNTALSVAEKSRIANTITEIERENAEILERVQCWQEHAKILLRMKA